MLSVRVGSLKINHYQPTEVLIMGSLLSSQVCLVVFCGGQGTRLQKVLKGQAKSMVQLNRKPYLDGLLGFASQQGIRYCILCVSPSSMANIMPIVGNGTRYGLSLSYSVDSGLVENAGAYWQARSLISLPTVICINGDTIVDVSFEHLFRSHITSRAVATIVGSMREDQPHSGAIEVGLDGWVRAIREDEQDRGAIMVKDATSRYFSNSGVYVFDRERVAQNWPAPFQTGKLENGLLKHLASNRILHLFDNGTRFLLDIGTPERLSGVGKRMDQISKLFPL